MGIGTRTVLVALAGVATLVAAAPSAAQVRWNASADDEACNRQDRGRDYEGYCEVRTATLPAGDRLVVDGGTNGGIEVTAWDRSEIGVRARVSAHARGAERARELASQVRLLADDGRLGSDGPGTGRRESWAVSWEVMVPRSTDLSLETHNGGISVEGVEGAIDFDALNGGVHLVAVAGDVRGRTVNGGLHVELTGSTWAGRGLDVETTNGGVTLEVPEGYSAELETGTVNGGMDIGFPVTVRGRIGRSLTTTLGDGGPRIRATTTNGGVKITRR